MSYRSSACLACGAGEESLSPFLDLGETPLANAYVAEEDLEAPELRVPLAVSFCERCGLVQLTHVVPPEILFADYAYMTGASSTMVRHFADSAEELTGRFSLGAEDLVVEIASNDGTLLSAFLERGTKALGVEPAANLVEVAREKGVESVPRFFGTECARELRAERGPAALVCGNNVLAHVPDLAGVLEGCRVLTEPEGVVSIEVPYLVPMLDELEYDTIYHEHLSYFSVRALAGAFERAGLAILDVQRLPVHGGSLRVLARASDGGPEHGPRVAELLRDERERGLERIETFAAFAERVAANRQALLALLRGLSGDGKRVAAYGAPAKGNTLLNYCGIGTDLVEYTVDRNPLKVGRYTPGMHLPIRPVETLREDRPDHALILPWNLADEIVSQEVDYTKAGGTFLVPIPEPRALA